MSKKPQQAATQSTPPHSLELRAKQRKMPSTPGVHRISRSGSAENPTGSEGGGGGVTESDDEISPRLSDIHLAISQVPLDDEKQWTKTRGPKVSALEAILGYDITEAERDQAWAIETRGN